MTKKKEMLDNKRAIEDLEKQHKHYTEEHNKLQTLMIKTQGALEVLKQIEKGVEIPNDSESTN